MLYSYLNLESTKTTMTTVLLSIRLYSYLNLESTKTHSICISLRYWLYSYLNLESTKTREYYNELAEKLYSYLNLESTKTSNEILMFLYPHSDYKNNNCPCQSLLSKNFCKSFSSDVWEYLIR